MLGVRVDTDLLADQRVVYRIAEELAQPAHVEGGLLVRRGHRRLQPSLCIQRLHGANIAAASSSSVGRFVTYCTKRVGNTRLNDVER